VIDLVVAWALFPLVLTALSWGLGLLVQCAAGWRLPGVLLLPVGMAALIVASQFVAYWPPTAPLTPFAVALLAVAGFAAAWRAGELATPRVLIARIDRPAALAALGIFAVFAAPIVLSGEATFAGYTILGDTSVHFVLIDQLMAHGHSLDGLAPSAYQAAVRDYFSSGYPLGSHTALGAARGLVGVDVAWVYQPFIAYVLAMLGLSALALARLVVPGSPRWQAFAAFLSAMPALVVGYALQGSIKELVTAWLVTLLAALLPSLVAARPGPRSVVPFAVASAAGLAAIGVAVAPWLAPFALAALVALLLRRRALRPVLVQAAAWVVVTAVLAIPTWVALGSYLDVTRSVVTAKAEYGNLLQPISSLQVFGAWFSGDYRLRPESSTPAALNNISLTYMAIGALAAAALLGLAAALRARAWPLLVYWAVSALACIYVVRTGSPWADGKAQMIAAPALMLGSALGPAALWARGLRRESVVFGAVIGIAVVASAAMQYHSVSLAPRDRLDELTRLGELTAGRGPLLHVEFEEWAKHFERDSQPQVAYAAPDLDTMSAAELRHYPYIALRRTPTQSRPPAAYERVWSGRWYELWARRKGPLDDVRARLPLGEGGDAGARASCSDVRHIARHGARLAFVERPQPLMIDLRKTSHPATWVADASGAPRLMLFGPGIVRTTVNIPRPGRYSIWVGGSHNRQIAVRVDGRVVGVVRRALDTAPGTQEVATIDVAAGAHTIDLVRGGGDLRPGNGDANRWLGPVVLDPTDPRRLETMPAAGWRSLCGRRLDWIEAIGAPAGRASAR
jgi:hypothetical protein